LGFCWLLLVADAFAAEVAIQIDQDYSFWKWLRNLPEGQHSLRAVFMHSEVANETRTEFPGLSVFEGLTAEAAQQ